MEDEFGLDDLLGCLTPDKDGKVVWEEIKNSPQPQCSPEPSPEPSPQPSPQPSPEPSPEPSPQSSFWEEHDNTTFTHDGYDYVIYFNDVVFKKKDDGVYVRTSQEDFSTPEKSRARSLLARHPIQGLTV